MPSKSSPPIYASRPRFDDRFGGASDALVLSCPICKERHIRLIEVKKSKLVDGDADLRFTCDYCDNLEDLALVFCQDTGLTLLRWESPPWNPEVKNQDPEYREVVVNPDVATMAIGAGRDLSITGVFLRLDPGLDLDEALVLRRRAEVQKDLGLTEEPFTRGYDTEIMRVEVPRNQDLHLILSTLLPGTMIRLERDKNKIPIVSVQV